DIPLLFGTEKKHREDSEKLSLQDFKMMMKSYFGRFLLRQYVYPLMCFLLLLLLIKWNSQPQKLIIEHSKWHDEVAKEIQIERNIDQVRDLPKVGFKQQNIYFKFYNLITPD